MMAFTVSIRERKGNENFEDIKKHFIVQLKKLSLKYKKGLK